jgi:hypothetical protein
MTERHVYDLRAHIATLLTEEADTPPDELADLVLHAAKEFPKLRSCVFCGGPPVLMREGIHAFVECMECKARGPAQPIEMPLAAADKWNL